jgi:CRP/FNR family cyclic AMP-dependent transcriptional regulator
MDATLEALHRIALFAGLSDQTLARLARTVSPRPFAPGQMVILEGEPCRAAYFVAAGRVRVYRLSASGRQQVLLVLGPGEAFNTVPAFQPQGRNHATVEGITSGLLYVLAAEDLRRLVVECPDLALAVLQDFADKLDHLTDLVEDLSLRTVRSRLARFLLEQADGGAAAPRWTQDEMAAQLGTVRDVVGRTLRAFADANWVRLDHNRIVLLDREGLQAEAEG